ncbi:MAG TPA: tetratricopeptide repeat protein [Candidatus Acidoferrum sp.]|nr:tetratricopeptide repeat protein [Candidatus Acidoferrum sp.]
MIGVLVVVLVLGIPALAFAVWPLWSRRGTTILRLPPGPRGELLEQKRQAVRSLRELAFEHEAGHISDDDYADLRARYEGETAAVLVELDRLGPAPAEPPPAAARRGRGWRHPLAIGAAAAALLVFGIGIGAGIVRYTAPEPPDPGPMPGSRPLAPIEAGPPPSVGGAPPSAGGAPPSTGGAPRAVTPEMLQGMLQAARSSLFEGRYGEAIAAYQAILKRDPKNVDAMTHLALIVAIGGHADTALETFDKVLGLDPNYEPALLYRGQVLYESKQDTAGAIKSWEKFLALTPPGEDRDRVTKMIADAKAAPAPAKK